MSTQSPLPQNDPMLIAFQKLKKTPEYQNTGEMINDHCSNCPLVECNFLSAYCIQSAECKLELHREAERIRKADEQKYAPLYTGCGTWDRSTAKKGLMRKG